MGSGLLPPGKALPKVFQKPRPSHRLTRPWMFKAVLEKGKSLKSPPLSLRYLRHFDREGVEAVDMTRLGFIVRKKTGHSPMRNALRRVLREVYRSHAEKVTVPTWLVFDILPQAAKLTRTAFRLKGEELMLRLLSQPPSQPPDLSAPARTEVVV